jgi:septum formation protein
MLLPMAHVILASTSPYRRQLLERLGLPFEVEAPGVDEGTVQGLGYAPRRLAEELAAAKAAAVARRHPAALVIGSDQVCALGERIFGKPGTAAAAVEQLSLLSGRTHELLTAVCLRRGEQVLSHTDVARLTLRELPLEALGRYVAADRPLDCAGSYKLEQRGIALFERLECEDHSAITGLPLLALCRMLRAFGVELP